MAGKRPPPSIPVAGPEASAVLGKSLVSLARISRMIAYYTGESRQRLPLKQR